MPQHRGTRQPRKKGSASAHEAVLRTHAALSGAHARSGCELGTRSRVMDALRVASGRLRRLLANSKDNSLDRVEFSRLFVERCGRCLMPAYPTSAASPALPPLEAAFPGQEGPHRYHRVLDTTRHFLLLSSAQWRGWYAWSRARLETMHSACSTSISAGESGAAVSAKQSWSPSLLRHKARAL